MGMGIEMGFPFGARVDNLRIELKQFRTLSVPVETWILAWISIVDTSMLDINSGETLIVDLAKKGPT